MKYDSLNNPSTNYLTDQSVSEIKFHPNYSPDSSKPSVAAISFRFRNLRFTFVGEEAKMIAIIDKVKAVSELSGSDTVKFEALTSLLLTSGATVGKFELIQPHISVLTNSRNIWDQANVESLVKWDRATEFYNK